MSDRIVDMDVRNEGLPLSIVVVSSKEPRETHSLNMPIGTKDIKRRRSVRHRGVGGSCVSLCSASDTITWGKMDDGDEDDKEFKDDDDCRSVNSCAQVSWLDSVGSSLGIGDATSEDCSMDSEDRHQCYSQSDDEFDFVDEVDDHSLNPQPRDDSVFDADEVALLNSCWDNSHEDEQSSDCEDSGDDSKPKTKNESSGQRSIIMNRQKKMMTMMMIRNQNNQEVSDDDDDEDENGKETGHRNVKPRLKRQFSSSVPSSRREKFARILPESSDVESKAGGTATAKVDDDAVTKRSRFNADRAIAAKRPPQEITVANPATTSSSCQEEICESEHSAEPQERGCGRAGKRVSMGGVALKGGFRDSETDLRGLVQEHRYEDALRYLQRNPFASMMCDSSQFNVLFELVSTTRRSEEKGGDAARAALISAVLQRGGGHAVLTDCNMTGESTLHNLVVRGCSCQTEEEVKESQRRNQLLQLVLDAYPHAVYQEKRRSPMSTMTAENGRTMLDDFANVWSTLTGQRADDVTDEAGQEEGNGGNDADAMVEENDGQHNGDDHSSGGGSDEADGCLHADLQEALSSCILTSKECLSESLKVIFDRYEQLLRAAMKTTENRQAIPFYSLGTRPVISPKSTTAKVPKISSSEIHDSSVLMCAASCKTFVPESMFRLAAKFSKASKGGSGTNSFGQVPLAVLSANWTSWQRTAKATENVGRRSFRSDGGHFAAVTEASPGSAAIRDWEGRLPLHTALDSGVTWEEGVGVIFADYTKGISIRDPRTRLFPFMLAAMGTGSPASADEGDIDTTFRLLREDPTLVASKSTTKQQLHDKIMRLEKEKEELDRLLRTLQAPEGKKANSLEPL